jgi:hypothetical protein
MTIASGNDPIHRVEETVSDSTRGVTPNLNIYILVVCIVHVRSYCAAEIRRRCDFVSGLHFVNTESIGTPSTPSTMANITDSLDSLQIDEVRVYYF